MTDINKLEQDKLEKVTGGVRRTAKKVQLMGMSCPYCGEIFQADVQKESVKCASCHKTIEIKG